MTEKKQNKEQDQKTAWPPLMWHKGADIEAMAKELNVKIPLESPFTVNDLNKVFVLLRATIRQDAVESTSKDKTGKGYDTTGYGYQALVDRLNEVLGIGHWEARIADTKYTEAKYSNGRAKHIFELLIRLEIGYPIFYDNKETGLPERFWFCMISKEMYGTHESPVRGDAWKGSFTNGLKKCAGFFGPGADAYLGILDDDNRPLPPGFEGETVGTEGKKYSSDYNKNNGQRPNNNRTPKPDPLIEANNKLKMTCGELTHKGYGKDDFTAMAQYVIKKDKPETLAETNLVLKFVTNIKEGKAMWPPEQENTGDTSSEETQGGAADEVSEPGHVIDISSDTDGENTVWACPQGCSNDCPDPGERCQYAIQIPVE